MPSALEIEVAAHYHRREVRPNLGWGVRIGRCPIVSVLGAFVVMLLTTVIALISKREGASTTTSTPSGLSCETRSWRSNDTLLIVAADGSGNCTTIQGAIDLLTTLAAVHTDRFIIQVRPGTYREKVRVSPLAPMLTLQGLGRQPEDVMVVWDDSEYIDGPQDCRQMPDDPRWIWDSQTLQVAADDFTVADMSIWNSACGNERGRNFAISVIADRAAFFRVRVLGGQDTFYTGNKRVYVMGSFINGTVDFVFGGGSAVFESCEIREDRIYGGFLTAAKGHDVSQVDGDHGLCNLGWGEACSAFVFNQCILTSSASNPHVTYLGRPWNDWSTVVFLNTWMDQHIAAAGWSPWIELGLRCDSGPRCDSVFYAEFNSTGPGSDSSSRVSWSRQMNETEVDTYATVKVLRGWQPVDPGNRPPTAVFGV